IHQSLAEAMVEVCIGEIKQIKDLYNRNQNIRHYLRRIKRKTALLTATSCKLGAIAAGLSENHIRKLYKYGYYIDMSYQLIDDILHFISTTKVLGKPSGNDLRQGNITLPVLIAMEDQPVAKTITDVFQNPSEISDEDVKGLI